MQLLLFYHRIGSSCVLSRSWLGKPLQRQVSKWLKKKLYLGHFHDYLTDGFVHSYIT